ncbi:MULTISPECIES: acyltransferase family protein [Mesorhizobium]|nr:MULTISPECIES: acyltransferase [Mesorhizobium]
MRTIGSVLDASRGLGAGFDFVRLALATSILAFHSIVVVGRLDLIEQTPLWLTVYGLVPMFFALSGFLISGSALRLSLPNFLLNRSLRIVPALAVEITVSALILGPIFTQFSLFDYFTSKDFFQYFLNIIGLIQYDLPGVFLHNESAGIVNLSLWTIPYEILCYAIMAAFIIFGLLKRPKLIIAAFLIYVTIPLVLELIGLRDNLPKIADSLFFGRGTLAFQCFVLGSLAYVYRHRIPMSATLFGAAVIFAVLIAVVGNTEWRSSGFLNLVMCLPFTYITLFVGLCKIPPVPFYSTGDYSYGIYLYGYPIQQAIVASMPAHGWGANFIAAILTVSCLAAFSWHWIEKPILTLRKNFSFVGRQISQHEKQASHPNSQVQSLS